MWSAAENASYALPLCPQADVNKALDFARQSGPKEAKEAADEARSNIAKAGTTNL